MDTLAVEIGPRRLGVRTTSISALDMLRHRLVRYLVDDPDVPPNYSLEIAADPSGRKLHRLYEANALVLRSRDMATLVDAIETMMATHEAQARSLVTLRTAAVVGANGAVIVPDGMHLGATTGKAPGPIAQPVWCGPACVDPATAELVLPALSQAQPPGRTSPVLEPDATIAHRGRYRIRAVCHVGRGATELEEITGTEGVYALTQAFSVQDRESAKTAVATAIAMTEQGVPVLAAPLSTLDELVDS